MKLLPADAFRPRDEPGAKPFEGGEIIRIEGAGEQARNERHRPILGQANDQIPASGDQRLQLPIEDAD
jgi:hypothetical protein